MADQDNRHGESRFDRIEGIIEALAGRQALIEDGFARLLKAQVVMVDSMTTLGGRMDHLTALNRQSDERLNAPIAIVDDPIRRGPLQPPHA
jgi:hypothetical protein